MTDQEKKLGDKFAAYSILPKAEQRGFLIAYRLLEDEIDELTKQLKQESECVEFIKTTCDNYEKENAELTKEVERLRKESKIKSDYVFVRYINWNGQDKIQAVPAKNEDSAKEWLSKNGFEKIKVKQIYF